jgi:hypothetical protein
LFLKLFLPFLKKKKMSGVVKLTPCTFAYAPEKVLGLCTSQDILPCQIDTYKDVYGNEKKLDPPAVYACQVLIPSLPTLTYWTLQK